MGLELRGQANDALVERVALQTLDRDDDRLVHLVGHDSSDLFLLQCRAIAGLCGRRGAHSSLPPVAALGAASLLALLALLALFALVVVRLRRSPRRAGALGAGAGRTTMLSSSPRSVMTVRTRATVRRAWVSWLWSVSWRVASWKRRSYR